MQPGNTSTLFRTVRKIQALNNLKKYEISGEEIFTLAKVALLKPIDKRNEYDAHIIQRMMSELKFFMNLKTKHGLGLFKEVCANLYYKQIAKDQNVIQMNDNGKTFYVILSGSVSIKLLIPTNQNHVDILNTQSIQSNRLHSEFNTIEVKTHPPQYQKNMNNEKLKQGLNDFELQEVSILTLGDTFGEISLMEWGQKTTAYVDAKEDCEFACMDKNQYQKVLGQIKQKEIAEKIQFLKQVSFLHGWLENELKSLSCHFQAVSYDLNQAIFNEGDSKTEYMYVVKSGEVVLKKSVEKNVTKSNETEFFGMDSNCRRDIIQKSNITVCKLSQGETFGEEGFLYYNTRQFTAQCSQGATQLLRISKVDLEKRLWYQNSRGIFEKVISNKWQWRYNQMNQIFLKAGKSTSELENMKINHHISLMRKLLVPAKLAQLTHEDAVEAQLLNEIAKQDEEIKQRLKLNQVASTSSSLLFSFIEAKNTFGKLQNAKLEYVNSKVDHHFGEVEKGIVKNHVANKISLSLIKLQAFRSPTKAKKQLDVKQKNSISQKSMTSYSDSRLHIGSNVPSLNNVELVGRQKFLSLEKKFDNYQSLVGTFTDEEDDAQFNKTLQQYTKKFTFQNQNVTERHSKKALLIDQYQGCNQDDQLKTPIVLPNYKVLSDNQVRVRQFMKQLNKLQKRLETYQLIKQGVLKCDNQHYVNEEGNIVEFKFADQDIEHQIMVNGIYVKAPQFNFVLTKDSKNIFRDKERVIQVDGMIDDLKYQIDQLEVKAKKQHEIAKNLASHTIHTNMSFSQQEEISLQNKSTKIVKVKPLNLDFGNNNNFLDINSQSPTKYLMNSARNSKQLTSPMIDTRRSQDTLQILKGSMLTQTTRNATSKNPTSRKSSQTSSIIGLEGKSDKRSIKSARVLKYI